MRIVAIDHVQLAMPRGAEDEARAFFVDVLGFLEVEKPESLRAGGGLWLESAGVRLHLGVEEPFSPARKAHPCFAVDDLDGLAVALEARGLAVKPDDRIAGTRRFFTADPFGNRLEFMQA